MPRMNPHISLSVAHDFFRFQTFAHFFDFCLIEHLSFSVGPEAGSLNILDKDLGQVPNFLKAILGY